MANGSFSVIDKSVTKVDLFRQEFCFLALRRCGKMFVSGGFSHLLSVLGSAADLLWLIQMAVVSPKSSLNPEG